MPSCSKTVNPRNVEIVFTEDDHKYRSIVDGNTIEYTSITRFVGGCFPPFDPTGSIAERCAAKEGISVREIQERWRLNAKESCDFGTKVHSICEDVLLGRQIRERNPINEKETKTFSVAERIAKTLKQKVDVLGVEKIVFDERLGLAGTVDFLARSRKNGKYLILDWKTNKEIETENKYSKFGLPPLEDVPDCNFWHYALQLSAYQFMLKFGGYVEAGSEFQRFIVHLTPSGHRLYELPDLTDRVRDVIIWKFSKNGSLGKIFPAV